MSVPRRALTALVGATLMAACERKTDATVTLPADQASRAVKRDEPPVPLDPTPVVEYPEALYRQRIGGTVLLRLFITEKGTVVPESTRVQESSGYPALDSAALAAAKGLKYAPALRDGVPAAEAFLQPFRFRHPDGGGLTP
ncbi:MAG: energy transducer TonB [Gemmatimonadota bacterium]